MVLFDDCGHHIIGQADDNGCLIFRLDDNDRRTVLADDNDYQASVVIGSGLDISLLVCTELLASLVDDIYQLLLSLCTC